MVWKKHVESLHEKKKPQKLYHLALYFFSKKALKRRFATDHDKKKHLEHCMKQKKQFKWKVCDYRDIWNPSMKRFFIKVTHRQWSLCH